MGKLQWGSRVPPTMAAEAPPRRECSSSGVLLAGVGVRRECAYVVVNSIMAMAVSTESHSIYGIWHRPRRVRTGGQRAVR